MPGVRDRPRARRRRVPEEVWDALTTGIGGWLWPMEYQPHAGGTASSSAAASRPGTPPHHHVGRNDGPDGWFNQLEESITAPDG